MRHFSLYGFQYGKAQKFMTSVFTMGQSLINRLNSWATDDNTMDLAFTLEQMDGDLKVKDSWLPQFLVNV